MLCLANAVGMKSVLVTGASSGIGKATALLLARSGYLVFAGVRKVEDGEALKAEEPRIEPIVLEVTDRESIGEAVREVSAHVDGLSALVNNAGVSFTAPLEFQDLGEIERVFAINVFGLIAVTQAFLPLLRKGRGRVVNVGSVGDRFTVPFGGALCASKSAVRSLTEALRMELHPFGIHVALIQPASVCTAAVDKFAEDAREKLATLPSQARVLYGEMYDAMVKRASAEERAGSPPEVIAEAILEAVSAREPRTRYPAGKRAGLLTWLPALLPDRLQDAAKLFLLGIPLAFGAYHVVKKTATTGAVDRKGSRTRIAKPVQPHSEGAPS